MAAIEAMNAGLAGVQFAGAQLAGAAQQIAGQAEDLASPLVQLGVSARQTEASVAVVRSADDMIGTLLDVLA